MNTASPTTYQIATQFVVSSIIPGLDSASSRLMGLSNIGTGLASKLASAFGIAAGAYGLGKLVSGLVSANAELQQAQVGIGGLISSLGHVSMATGLGLARQELAGLRKDAAAGAGELSDYVKGFQTILGPAGSSGATLEQTRTLNKLAIGAAFALRGDAGINQVPLQLVRALTTGVHQRTGPIVEQALNAIGMTDTQFNKLAPEKRFATLTRAFESFSGVVEEAGKTWSAQVDTLKDNIKQLGTSLSSPLFDRLSASLANANKWLLANSDLLNKMADGAGQRIGAVFDRLAEHPAGVVGTVGALAGAALGGKLASGIKMAAPAFAPAGSVWNAAAGRYMNPATGAFMAEGTLGAAGAGVATLGVVGAIVAGIALLGGSIAAAAAHFPNDAAAFGAAIGGVGVELGNLWVSVSKFFENHLLLFVGDELLKVGTILVEAAGKTARVIAILVDALTGIIDIATGPVASAIDAAAHGRFGDASALMTAADALFTANNLKADIGFANLMKDLPKPPVIAPGTGPGNGKGEVPHFTTNINGPITIKIEAERLDDPDTVASSFQKALAKVRSYPTGSSASRLVPRPI